MKMTMPVSALRMPRPAPAEVPPVPDENPYSAPAALSAPVYAMSSAQDEVLAGRWSRFGAQVLDNILLLASAIPGYVVFFGQAAAVASSGSGSEADVPMAGLWLILLGLGGFGIYNLVKLARTGQTVGKKIVGIRIVNNDDGGHPGGVRLIVMRAMVKGAIGILLGPLFAFIFREDRRCIHDLIAGTKVVEAR